ncbi:hypothetical protein BKA59DRAFT_94343 [Fusarium tricinctum]|uniref:Uncharacterized protein n=1 Tax=Fusarium tricinctum TaxID=61284 RepID=A0A8K0S5C6_9HYPO|nr:hypothetical protein BKA59DRAFT_94343 [Fusarium tricinctum]
MTRGGRLKAYRSSNLRRRTGREGFKFLLLCICFIRHCIGRLLVSWLRTKRDNGGEKAADLYDYDIYVFPRSEINSSYYPHVLSINW